MKIGRERCVQLKHEGRARGDLNGIPSLGGVDLALVAALLLLFHFRHGGRSVKRNVHACGLHLLQVRFELGAHGDAKPLFERGVVGVVLHASDYIVDDRVTVQTKVRALVLFRQRSKDPLVLSYQ